MKKKTTTSLVFAILLMTACSKSNSDEIVSTMQKEQWNPITIPSQEYDLVPEKITFNTGETIIISKNGIDQHAITFGEIFILDNAETKASNFENVIVVELFHESMLVNGEGLSEVFELKMFDENDVELEKYHFEFNTDEKNGNMNVVPLAFGFNGDPDKPLKLSFDVDLNTDVRTVSNWHPSGDKDAENKENESIIDVFEDEGVYNYEQYSKLDSPYTLKHGEIQQVIINGNVLVVKTKIEASITDKLTIEQNYINVEDLVKNQKCNEFDEIQYWAVADMTIGDEEKIISFTIDKKMIDLISNEEITIVEYEGNIIDFWGHPSLKK